MIEKKDILYLRDLAKKQLELSHLPVMDERKMLWKAHNSCRGVRPMIYVDLDTQCIEEIIPKPKCDGLAGQIERQIVINLLKHDIIDDDTVMPEDFTIPWQIKIDEFGITNTVKHARDDQGRSLGYAINYSFQTPGQTLGGLKPARCNVNREGTVRYKQLVEGILGDILPVRVENSSIRWFLPLTYKILTLMSMENMLISIYDEPDQLSELMDFLVDNTLQVLCWEEEEGLLTLNNGNDYAGSGSLGFTNELPQDDYQEGMNVRIKDIWINTNSQETLGVSPAVFKEFFYPSYRKLAEMGGLVYYGCCEPVHNLWLDCLENLPNLRKVSISKWCDEEFMGEMLRGKRIIYCRKPDPNFIGVGRELDESAYKVHISKTLEAAKGCELEFSFRDIYTQGGNPNKFNHAIKILRKLINQMDG